VLAKALGAESGTATKRNKVTIQSFENRVRIFSSKCQWSASSIPIGGDRSGY
jgi:hypothetical protein